MWKSGWTGKGKLVLSSGVRALGASEGFFGHFAENSTLRSLYYKEAMYKKLSRKDAVTYVVEKMAAGKHPKDYVFKAEYMAGRLALNTPPESGFGQCLMGLS